MGESGLWGESSGVLGKNPNFYCKPLDTLRDINEFISDPPAWRTLCESYQEHSHLCIRNKDLCQDFDNMAIEKTQNFCHFDPNAPVPPRHLRTDLPQTLVCHDMANGYHDDSAINGTNNHSAYTFYNWAAVDIFCYFSHHLITIPPVGWINVAHAHGVKVIGTIITEWAEGAQFWNKVFESETEINNIISALVTIAKTLKFEGWLLNVENKTSQPAKLLQFVKSLHTMLHKEINNAVLIWYDSVTIDGDLVWQNKLDDKNRDFFAACDGIFTNYSWTEEDVRQSVMEAGDRVRDLYIGIDVWGRHFYGGGMFNTQQAVKFVHAQGCSLAIFAPAWTYEAMKGDDEHEPDTIIMGEKLDNTERFLLRDRALWDSLWPYLNTKLPCSLPFKSSFCRGHGKRRWMYGEVVSPGTWYNIRHQQYQPTSAHGAHHYVLSTVEKFGNINIRSRSAERSLTLIRESLMALETGNQEESGGKRRRSILKVGPLQEGGCTITLPRISKPSLPSRVSRWFKRTFHIKKKDSPRRRRDMNVESQIHAHASRPDLSLVAIEERVTIKLGAAHRQDRTRLTVAYLAEERDCLEVYFQDSFTGGSCIKLNPSDLTCEYQRCIRLMHCQIPLVDTLYVCMVTKILPSYKNQHLIMKLMLQDEKKEERRVQLVGRYMHSEHMTAPLNAPPNAPPTKQSSQKESTLYPLEPDGAEFKVMQTYLLLNEPGFYVPLNNGFGWKVFYYLVRFPQHTLMSISARTHQVSGPILLGQFGMAAYNPGRAEQQLH